MRGERVEEEEEINSKESILEERQFGQGEVTVCFIEWTGALESSRHDGKYSCGSRAHSLQ